MNIVGVNFESIADGEGVRVVIFCSGCLHNCKGCHNPTSHSFTVGREFTNALQSKIISYIKNTPFISGITLSGGDPMYNAKELLPFVQRIRNEFPNKTVWIYSGFTYHEILKDNDMLELLKLCDVLVDGRFIIEQRDITLPYRGSRNQNIIDINKSINSEEVVLWNTSY